MTAYEKLERAMRVWLHVSLHDLFWYLGLASAMWLFFYVLFRTALRGRRIHRRDATSRQMRRELLHSVRSITIFGLTAAGIVFMAMAGWTRFYGRIEQYGWGWFAASIVLMILMHDTYFYWTHRLMHHRRLYRFFHKTHHLSTNPTPWAAYAFSPAEAFVQAGIGVIVAVTIPTHALAFAIFMTWQIAFNVLGHCGYEIYPSCFLRSTLGKFLNSPTHHGLHHEKFTGNFGLYFNVWDRLMGTNHPEYEARFEAVTGGAGAPPAELADGVGGLATSGPSP